MKKMNVVLHILSDLNGKISGPFFGNPDTAAASKAYAQIRQELNCQAVVYGQVTMEEGYCDGLWTRPHNQPLGVFDDYKAPTHAKTFIVSLDPQGTLVFNDGVLVRKNRAPAHVIQILTGQVSAEYLNELKSHDVSWIYAGEEVIDLKSVLDKLHEIWEIDSLMVAGGGVCDWSFARENLLDELSLVISPVASADNQAVSIFMAQADQTCDPLTQSYQLQEARVMEGNAVWLHYSKKKIEGSGRNKNRRNKNKGNGR